MGLVADPSNRDRKSRWFALNALRAWHQVRNALRQ
jgi:hypothetical protein